MRIPNRDPNPGSRTGDDVLENERVARLPEPDVRQRCFVLELWNRALRELQHDLQISREKYRDLYEFAPAGYVTLDADGRIRDANFAAASLLGEMRSSLLNRQFQSFLEPESLGEFDAFRGRIREDGGIEQAQVRVRATQDHKPAWVLVEGKAGTERTLRIVLLDITGHKRVEETLKWQADLLNLTHDAIMVLDTAGRIIFWNRGAEEQYGWKAAETQGKRVFGLLKTTFPEPLDTIRAALHRSGRWEGELVQTRRDGRRVVMGSRWTLQRDEQGDPVVIMEINNDITDRRRAEERYQESAERQALLLRNARDVIYRIDFVPQRRYTYVSPASTAMIGYTPEEHYRDPYLGVAITHPDDRPRMEAAARGEIPLDRPLTVRWIRRGGETVWVEMTSVPICDEDGRIVGIEGIARDVTERRRLEERLRQSEERFRLLTENASDLVVVLDPDGRITYASPSVKRVGGYALEEVIGKDIAGLAHPDDRDRVRDTLAAAAVRPKERLHLEVRIRHISGDWLCFDVTGVNLLDEPAIRGYVVNARDITDRKRVENALRRRTEDLLKGSEELEAAREEANIYLDIITHDVRNVNNVSSMYVDLLVEIADGDLRTYAEKLRESIGRSSEILANVATLRRAQEETALVPVNLDAVIRREIANFPDAAIRYIDPSVEVLADTLLSTAFTNLIGNAVKFGGADVRITIRVEERDGDVLVSVEDTGPGIPDEVKGKLFTRFERGRATGRGEGLGLFIVRKLVERYGGKVWIEDRVPGCHEGGTTFRFTLRRAESASPPAP